MLSAGMKTYQISKPVNCKSGCKLNLSQICTTWTPLIYQKTKDKGVNEWVDGGATKKSSRKCHEIKKILTLTSSKTSLETTK